MSSRKNKETYNIENLCPIARKRSATKTFTAVKITNFECASSPSVLTNELIEEMGIGMLDSEESSSSVVSAIALAVSNTSDENSNESTPHLTAVKMQHQRIVYTNNCADTTLEAIAENLNNNSSCATEMYDEARRQKLSTEKLMTQQQNKKVSFSTVETSNSLGYNSNSSSPTANKRTRNPLATVSCNNNNKQQPQPLTGSAHALNVMPSTSRQAMHLLRNQVQMCTQKASATKSSFVPTESFFLYRTPAMSAHIADGTNHFQKLSDEMILHIFKWLPKKTLLRLSTVCRRFNCCAKDESLWSRLDLGGRSLRAGALEHIITRNVVILRLAQAQLHEPAFPRTLPKSDDIDIKLQYLDLSLTTISKTSLKTLLSLCRSLKKISLENAELDNEICIELAENSKLEALNLAMCSGLDGESVRHMLSKLQNLNSLNISWTYLTTDAVTAIVANITPNIMRLNVAGCRRTMFDAHVLTLAKRCLQLIELDLSDCSSLTSEVIGIICKFKMLEYLSVSRCYLIPASAFVELKNLPTLKYLDVFGMLSDEAMELLEETFPKMGINKFIHSSVARPTVGTRRTSIWGLRTRD